MPQAARQQQSRPRSFLVGTQDVWEGGDYDQTYTVTNAQGGIPWALQATGWLRGLYLLCQGTGLTAGTAAADAPYNIFTNIELDDVNNEAIFGPFDGYTASVTNKLGGYYYADDPGTAPIYTLTGTVSTNNFTFLLYIPLELVGRDPIGAVASVNNTASLTLRFSLNATANVFGTPTGTLAVRIRGTQDFYWEPRTADKQGRPISAEPPASGTTQYWTIGSIAVAGAGTINSQLITGLGYPFREYHFIYRLASAARDLDSSANWPDPLIGIKFEANLMLSNIPKAFWQAMIARATGYVNASFDARQSAAGTNLVPGKENGVWSLFFNDDFFRNAVGSETRRAYLVTSPGSNFIFNGAMGAAGNLYSLVNYVAPGGGVQARMNTAALTGGQ